MSFIGFRDSFLKTVLDLLWGQWCILGVPGQASIRTGPYGIDPEALVLATCSFGRYDQRLFDGMLEWLIEHEQFVSLLRASTLIEKEGFGGLRIMNAVAAFLASEHKSSRWRKLSGQAFGTSEPEALFRFGDGSAVGSFGSPDPVFLSRGLSRGTVILRRNIGPFQISHPASFWLRLRAFMGVSSRTDAFLYLAVKKDGGHPSRIARELGYTQRGIDHALASMAKSGWIIRTESRREVVYAVSGPFRETLFSSYGGDKPAWLAWAPFFRALEVIWKTLGNPYLLKIPIGGQSAELQGAMQDAVFAKDRGGFSPCFAETTSRRGEDYINSLDEAWVALFSSLSE